MAEQEVELTLVTNKLDAAAHLGRQPTFHIIEVGQGKYSFEQFDKAMERGSKLFWYGYFRNTFLIVKQALALCEKEKFDAVFLTDVEYLVTTLLLKSYRRHLPPVIWHVQAANFTFESYAGSVFKKIYKVFQRGIFKSVLGKEVKGFAVLGDFHKHELKKQLQLDANFLIEMIPDGADTLTHPMEQQAARANIGLHYTGPVFLFLGMLRKDKGIEYLIESVSQLGQQDFKVVIAGAPFEWSAGDIQRLIDKYNVRSKIHLYLDYVPDHQLASYYLASDCVVFPYTNQYTGGCGPLTKGASTYKKPVIVTDVSDIGRMVRQYNNGLIVKPSDALSLSEGMRTFLDFPSSDKNVMIENAGRLSKRHSWPGVAESLIVLLKNAS
jgi:glycosyltransferase involved in cell wall biosynthesis